MKTIIIDGVEYDLTPKALFKKGDWIVYCNEDVDLITGIEDNGYLINEGGYIPFTCQGDMRYWTIQDAKDGDVLASNNGCPFIYKKSDNTRARVYCCVSISNNFCVDDGVTYCGYKETAKPATKEQRDLLFTKMKEAGYEWDEENKVLRKIEPKPQTELPKGEDYAIDGLWQAIQILEHSLGEVDGWQSDDGILEHKRAIEAVKRLYEQKATWSEEDEETIDRIYNFLWKNRKGDTSEIYQQEKDATWFKSLKDRMPLQPTK